MTKDELTARRDTAEFFEKRRRHTLLTKSPSLLVRSTRWWKLRIEYWKGSEEWVKFALSTKDITRRQEDIIADLEKTIQLQTQLQRNTRRVPADPAVAKKQKMSWAPSRGLTLWLRGHRGG
jgi:hypothetical protein